MSQTETVDSQDPSKVRLTDEQIDTLGEALRVAAVAMRNAAVLAEALGDPFVARSCVERAERYEDLYQQGANVTRITVRF